MAIIWCIYNKATSLKISVVVIYVMPVLAWNTRNFCTMLDFLQLALSNTTCCQKIKVIPINNLWSSLGNRWFFLCIYLNHGNEFGPSTCHSFSSCFSLPSSPDVKFYDFFLYYCTIIWLGGQRAFTLPMLLAHSPSFQWCPRCFFTFISSYVLLWLFHIPFLYVSIFLV